MDDSIDLAIGRHLSKRGSEETRARGQRRDDGTGRTRSRLTEGMPVLDSMAASSCTWTGDGQAVRRVRGSMVRLMELGWTHLGDVDLTIVLTRRKEHATVSVGLAGALC